MAHNMEAFLAFCEANNLNPMERGSNKAFEDSQRGPGGAKRSYQSKTISLVAHGVAEGETLFREATGIATRDRMQAASVLRWQLETEDGATNVRVFVVTQEL